MNLFEQYLLYLLRWQLSTPLIALVTRYYFRSDESWRSWKAAIVANLIGGLFFFWVDRWIFS